MIRATELLHISEDEFNKVEKEVLRLRNYFEPGSSVYTTLLKSYTLIRAARIANRRDPNIVQDNFVYITEHKGELK